jgi:DNA repair ATPase RecN
MSSDSRLQNLQKDLENVQRAQTDIREDIRNLQATMDAKIRRIQNEYGSDIQSLERKYDSAVKRAPDIARQVKIRQEELEREATSKTSSGGTSQRSGWLR